MSRVLILGSSGMLGHKVYNYLKKNSSFDLANFSGSRKLNAETILLNARNEKKYNKETIVSTQKIIINV